MKAAIKKYQLHFCNPILTSRGGMNKKNGYYLVVGNENSIGIGECSFIEGLSIDNLKNYENTLTNLCQAINSNTTIPDLNLFPSIQFGLETALRDLRQGGNKILFKSEFTGGEQQIPINGLVWMGKKNFMLQQITQKLKNGFRCIKIKVGAIDFAEEVFLLKFIRSKYPADIIEIRLDANGAFSYDTVFQKLEMLSKFQIHSIEQPIKPKQIKQMSEVCKQSPMPIALDEELIGVAEGKQDKILDSIKPAYIILKPSLLGGFGVCDKWIAKAELRNIKWWATSALESNIGLNAIAQWVFTKKNSMVQGLGTGSLYINNIDSPLYISNGALGYSPQKKWGDIVQVIFP